MQGCIAHAQKTSEELFSMMQSICTFLVAPDELLLVLLTTQGPVQEGHRTAHTGTLAVLARSSCSWSCVYAAAPALPIQTPRSLYALCFFMVITECLTHSSQIRPVFITPLLTNMSLRC